MAKTAVCTSAQHHFDLGYRLKALVGLIDVEFAFWIGQDVSGEPHTLGAAGTSHLPGLGSRTSSATEAPLAGRNGTLFLV
jgi:hypothetical protein